VSEDFGERLRHEVRAWQGRVLELVAEQGAERRTAARLASFSVNGAGLLVMLAVFAQTGGLTGAEVVVAGGTSAVSQKLLEAIFGDAAVRALAADARQDLLERVDLLLSDEADRFRALVSGAAPAPDAAAGLRAAAAELEQARRESVAVRRVGPAPSGARAVTGQDGGRTSWWRAGRTR
jgi:hypothetical protein